MLSRTRGDLSGVPYSGLSIASVVFVVAVCTVTASLGGWRERVACGAVLIAVLTSKIVQQTSATWRPVLSFMGVDIVVLIVLMGSPGGRVASGRSALWGFRV